MRKNGNIEDLQVKFLKLCAPFLSMIATDLFNKCLNCGIFPESYKLAIVTPIHKKNSKELVQNYRPISILKNMSKLFESLIYTRLSSVFYDGNLLSKNQFGFRRGKNTELACLNLIDRIMPAFQNGGYAICVFPDFTQCFDTLSRDIIIKKLHCYGLRGASLDLLKSYFSDRRQCVRYKNNVSSICEQEIGTIQGSKTGPMYFDICSNDLNMICSNKENLLFADDTCLVYTGDDLDTLIAHVNSRLNTIVDWCNANKLSLNPNKSEFMILTNRPIENRPNLYLNNVPITEKNSVKYIPRTSHRQQT